MGFKKAYLIGCDYTHSPQRMLHFYEKGKGGINYNNDYNKDYFELVKKKIDLITITNSKSTSKTLKYISYKDFTGKDEFYKENYDLLDRKTLEVLDDWGGYSVF